MRDIKNVWILSHASQQPPYNTMLRFHNWGKELVKRGYNVVIVAASTVHNTDIDVIDEIGSASAVVDGINYEYIKVPKYKGNGLARIQNMFGYCMGLRKYTKYPLKPDVIISTAAYKFPFVKHFFRKVPIVVDIVDLWPLSIIDFANVSKYNPLIQILYMLEKYTYKKADALIFSMEGGRQYVEEQKYANKIDLDKVFHINMGCDLPAIDKYKVENTAKLDWDMSKINLVYCGSVRRANNVGLLCEAAKELKLRGKDNIHFHIYGNGDEQEKLEIFCKTNELKNITFYGRIEKEKIPFILSNASANILNIRQVGVMRYGSSQSKLFDYLSSGKPIICNAHFGYCLIQKYNCGLITKDQTSESLVNAIEQLSQLTETERMNMGENGRRVAEMYAQPLLVDEVESIFDYIKNK